MEFPYRVLGTVTGRRENKLRSGAVHNPYVAGRDYGKEGKIKTRSGAIQSFYSAGRIMWRGVEINKRGAERRGVLACGDRGVERHNISIMRMGTEAGQSRTKRWGSMSPLSASFSRNCRRERMYVPCFEVSVIIRRLKSLSGSTQAVRNPYYIQYIKIQLTTLQSVRP